MKTIKVELLKPNDKNSVGYITKALSEIRNNPKNHSYSELEVSHLLKIENEFKESIKPYEDAINSINSIFKTFNKVLEGSEGVSAPIIEHIQNLYGLGWFINPDLIRDYTIEEVLELSQNNYSKQIENKLIKRHGNKKEINNILKRLTSTFPNRARINEEIYQSYTHELFSSVTTLCYTQADGICHEVWSYGFFDKDKKNKPFRTKLSLELDNFDFGFSSLFTTQLEMPENEITMYSKDDYFNDNDIKRSTFNRHHVIHGHSTNYGTKVNALRAILMLDFLHHFVRGHRKLNPHAILSLKSSQ